MCITSVSVRISDMIRHRIMVLLYFGETPHGGHAFVLRFSRNSYYTTICDRIARGTAPRIRIRGKSFFSTKKDGTKPSFLVTIFSWKIKAICTDFVRYCLCTVLPQKAYWFSAGASAAGAVFPAGAGAGAVAVTGLSERTPFRPAARPASP